jgi:2-hydroxychromene-2-carboxylate isomerase
MGQLIALEERLGERAALRLAGGRPAFYFDLACPDSYLVAERIERLLGQVDWIPVHRGALSEGRSAAPEGSDAAADERAAVEERAAALRLPLAWPDRYPFVAPRAMRAAAYASTGGAGARFALAAFRLTFCGGFDLDSAGTLAEASSAAGIPRTACLAAAGDETHDATLEATARGLRRRGVCTLPAIRAEDRWFQGESGLRRAAAIRRDAVRVERAAALPLAPPA